MDDEQVLTSVQNQKVKDVVRLRDRRHRDRSGEFLIEGYRELLRASKSGMAFERIFICPELFLGENEPSLILAVEETGADLWQCTEQVFRKMSYRDRPDGLLAVAKQMTRQLSDFDHLFEKEEPPLFLLAESIEKPGNLGTILRSSDAVGVDLAIVVDRCTDIHNPNVVRASVGTLFTVPVVEVSSDEVQEWLRKHSVKVLAATPAASHEYTDVDLRGPLAIAVGTEQLGLSDRWMNDADLQVRIPMMGTADSLNVAMATTIMLYEALRQRRRKG